MSEDSKIQLKLQNATNAGLQSILRPVMTCWDVNRKGENYTSLRMLVICNNRYDWHAISILRPDKITDMNYKDSDEKCDLRQVKDELCKGPLLLSIACKMLSPACQYTHVRFRYC